MTLSLNQPEASRRRVGAGFAARVLAFALAFFAAGAALAQEPPECARLRAALAAPVRQDPEAAAAASRARGELDRATAAARSMGCDNQQFLIFGQAPPAVCGGLKARVAALRGEVDSLSARASGDAGRKQALQARYDAVCVQRPKNFWETLFGGGRPEPAPIPETAAPPAQPSRETDEDDTRNGAHGGSQAVCVRTCDGGFFPLSFSARSASDDELMELCKALCPNAEVRLYTRSPNRDISTALGTDGTAYSDLPNALKYTKAVEPGCGCKPPNQSWVEALAHAEELLGEMGGAKASDTTVTEEQARALSQPAAKPEKILEKIVAGRKKPAPAKGAATVLDTDAPDGNPRQMRVVGPKL